MALLSVWEQEQKVERVKCRLPWFGLGGLILVLAMTVLNLRLRETSLQTQLKAMGVKYVLNMCYVRFERAFINLLQRFTNISGN